MQFRDVIGQETVKHQLADLLQQNRLSHALLFLGKEGSGALSLAMAFAQYIACEKVLGNANAVPAGPSLFGEPEHIAPKTPIWDSCGVCPACVKASQMIHPDIHYTYPVISRKTGDKPISTDYITEWREFMKQLPYGNVYDWLQFIGADNKQGNITAAECTDIIRKLNLKSYEGHYKVLIIWMPEYLDKEGNKLLKLIEEPPPDTVFLLVAESESQILPTILSRCQLVKIPRLTVENVSETLIQKNGLTQEQAIQVAAICEGNYREAQSLLQHAEEDWQSLLREWLNAILKNGPTAQVKWVDEVSKMGREKQKQFLRYFNHLLEQAIRVRMVGEGSFAMAANELDFAIRLNKIADVAQQQAIVEELDRAAYHIERNANAKMLFMALTIKLYHIIADKSLILVN